MKDSIESERQYTKLLRKEYPNFYPPQRPTQRAPQLGVFSKDASQSRDQPHSSRKPSVQDPFLDLQKSFEQLQILRKRLKNVFGASVQGPFSEELLPLQDETLSLQQGLSQMLDCLRQECFHLEKLFDYLKDETNRFYDDHSRGYASAQEMYQFPDEHYRFLESQTFEDSSWEKNSQKFKIWWQTFLRSKLLKDDYNVILTKSLSQRCDITGLIQQLLHYRGKSRDLSSKMTRLEEEFLGAEQPTTEELHRFQFRFQNMLKQIQTSKPKIQDLHHKYISFRKDFLQLHEEFLDNWIKQVKFSQELKQETLHFSPTYQEIVQQLQPSKLLVHSLETPSTTPQGNETTEELFPLKRLDDLPENREYRQSQRELRSSEPSVKKEQSQNIPLSAPTGLSDEQKCSATDPCQEAPSHSRSLQCPPSKEESCNVKQSPI